MRQPSLVARRFGRQEFVGAVVVEPADDLAGRDGAETVEVGARRLGGKACLRPPAGRAGQAGLSQLVELALILNGGEVVPGVAAPGSAVSLIAPLLSGAEAVVEKAAGGAVRELERQLPRKQTTTSRAKAERRLGRAKEELESKKAKASVAADSATELRIRSKKKKKKDKTEEDEDQ